jgi:hypothetical protein
MDFGWTGSLCGGWVCYVEQGRYGHGAKKATWLYAYGVEPVELRWGRMLDSEAGYLVSWCGNNVAEDEVRPRLSKKQASATPGAFRDELIRIALGGD